MIIAGGTAITLLSKNSVNFHLGVAIDPNLDEFKRLLKATSFEVPLIYAARLNFGIFNLMNGKTGYLKGQMIESFEKLLNERFNINEKPIQNTNLESGLSVTGVCLDIANFLGCSPIILDGVDLCYSSNKLYPEKIVDTNKDKDLFFKKNKNQKLFKTNLKWEIDRAALDLKAKSLKNKKFLNLTKNGMKIFSFKDSSYKDFDIFLYKSLDIKGYLHSLIEENSKKVSKNKISDFKNEIFNSLKTTKDLLEKIIKTEKNYEKILFLDDLENEFFYKFFLKDMKKILENHFENIDIFSNLLEVIEHFKKV